MQEEKIILNTSDEAATYRTGISGWVSRNGRFYGKDEHVARWDGATHILCECGKVTPKGYTRCAECREKRDEERYAALPKKKWDGQTMLYSDAVEEYFHDDGEVEDYCAENGCTVESLRLLICEPNYAREIEPNDYYHDNLPEGFDVPVPLLEAFDALNRFLRESKIVLSWSPGKFAADLSDDNKENIHETA